MISTDSQIIAGYMAWVKGVAYIDGAGNYRVRTGGESSGPVAPWNLAVKRAYHPRRKPVDTSQFHRDAMEYAALRAKQSVIIRVGSHRAGDKLKSALGRELVWHYTFKDGGKFVKVTTEEYEKVKGIKCVTKCRDQSPDTYSPCWS